MSDSSRDGVYGWELFEESIRRPEQKRVREKAIRLPVSRLSWPIESDSHY